MRIDPPKAGRGHATPIQPVQRAKCWRLLNLEPRFEWYHVRVRHNALIYWPYKETANVFLVTASISPSVLAVWELHALSPGRYTLDMMDLLDAKPTCNYSIERYMTHTSIEFTTV